MSVNLSPRESAPLPHAGYHGQGWRWPGSRFFEGWYWRITLPESQESWAWMAAILDPQDPTAHSGGSLQILTPNGTTLSSLFPVVSDFWASPEQLALGHWGQRQGLGRYLAPQPLTPEEFWHWIPWGYQATPALLQGCFRDDSSRLPVRWCLHIEPVYGYGLPQPQATMGVWSYLPVFEPGWQIVMAHGRASGWVQWGETQHTVQRVPIYAEKNWGGAFPQRWFWIQANGFAEQPDLSLTCAGGERKVLTRQEEVGMVSVHRSGTFTNWIPENSSLNWDIEPWGSWQVEAQRSDQVILLEGKTSAPPAIVKVPTAQGMQPLCRDSLTGTLRVKLWRRRGQVWSQDLTLDTDLAALETGGLGWLGRWRQTRFSGISSH